jgi:hypothetical protein
MYLLAVAGAFPPVDQHYLLEARQLTLLPALTLLFRLTLAGRFRAAARADSDTETAERGGVSTRVLTRLAIAFLIAGAGLLNLAYAPWAHAVGVVCLIGFIVLAFGAIVVPALDERTRTA